MKHILHRGPHTTHFDVKWAAPVKHDKHVTLQKSFSLIIVPVIINLDYRVFNS